MGSITVLGLGYMGFALADTMTKAGHDTIVWNRTDERAKPLVESGARLMPSPAEAISESPVTVVCVSNYEAADSFLRTPESLGALEGRILVQLTSGSPRLARSTHEWVKEAGAAYLDGEILAYVEQIGGPEAQILIAGDDDAFSQVEPLLRTLAPLDYLGDNPTRASALNLAILSGSMGLITGVLNGAAICEGAGISVAQYGKRLPPLMGYIADALVENLRRIEDGGLDESDAQIQVWAAFTDSMVECADDAGYDSEIPKLIQKFFGRAVEQGLGKQDVGALIKVLRPDGK